ncbi:glycosyltransferase family 4 protein [Pseudodesulfovibrio sp.]|uniref:glycosyltransferase family 4 protein n=1 Tax=unclassified Pseudodesulfovibrio TaxID=2661612 RepID=UPI003AFFD628
MPEGKRRWGTLDPFYEPGPVLGRTVANVRFLDTLLRADPLDEYCFFLGDQGIGGALREHLSKTAPALIDAGRIRILDRRDLPGVLSRERFHCFHLSDCIVSQPALARLRNRYAPEIFPITGIIHSLSYANYGGPFLRQLWPGATARDAIVCTSSAGSEAVERFFAWLREGYGLAEDRFSAPTLARIPLAVDTEQMAPNPERPEGGPVRLLVFGRLSHHSKMDLLPLLRALHRLAADGLDPSSVELVLAGWADERDDYLPMLKGLAANAAIPLTVHARPTEAEKIELFRSADIFISIADNPQETFGITVVEAGAFGLPSVVSDYDGYRDIVVHGETGMLVPTIGAPDTPDADLLAPLLFDNQYHLLLAQRTAVEIPALAEALGALIRSPELRRTMGGAARQRVCSHFSWSGVIRQYLELWDRLWETPVDPEALRAVDHPQSMPYGRLFGHYPTRLLAPGTMLRTGRTGEAFYREKDFPTLYAGMGWTIQPETARKLAFLARKAVDSGTLMRKLVGLEPHLDEAMAENHVLWALKHDILEIVKE